MNKKIARKIIPLVLTIIFTITLLGANIVNTAAYTNNDFEYSYVEYTENNEKHTGISISKYKNDTNENIIIPEEFDGYKVVEIKDLSFHSSKFKTIELPKTIRNIEQGAFWGCINLQSISFKGISNYFTVKDDSLYTKDMSILITTYTKSSKLNIPEGVKTIGEGAIDKCANLQEIVLPESLETIGNYAMTGNNIKEINIPKNVKEIGNGILLGCQFLTKINVDENNKNYTSKDGILYSKDMTELVQWPSGILDTSKISAVNKIRAFAFTYSNIREISIPSSVNEIGQSSFSECKNLENVKFLSGNGKNGIIEYNAFSNCISLKTINIPSQITSISYSAFGGCNNLLSINVDKNNSIYESIGGFLCNKSQKELIIGNPGLKSVVIPKEIKGIGIAAFLSNETIEEVKFNEGLEYISKFAFSGCKKLKAIKLPYGLKQIGDYAFDNCDNLNKIQIPSTVERIDRKLYNNDQKTVIYGEKDSYVEKYAQNYYYEFQPIEIIKPLKINDLLISENCKLGDTVNLAAVAEGKGKVKYRFVAQAGTYKEVIQDFNENNEITWTPSKPGK